jgi:hypothetical protein
MYFSITVDRLLMKGNPTLESIDHALDMAVAQLCQEVHVAVVSRGYAESKFALCFRCWRPLLQFMNSFVSREYAA